MDDPLRVTLVAEVVQAGGRGGDAFGGGTEEEVPGGAMTPPWWSGEPGVAGDFLVVFWFRSWLFTGCLVAVSGCWGLFSGYEM